MGPLMKEKKKKTKLLDIPLHNIGSNYQEV